VEGRHSGVDQALIEGGAWVQRSGGPASAAQVSLRGGGGHQSALYLEGVPLHSVRSQALDLSLLPLPLLSALSVEGGGDGARDGSAAQGGRVTLSLPSPPLGARAAARLGVTTQRGADVALNGGVGGAAGGVGLMASLGGGDGAFVYSDREGLSRRRAGAAYERLAGAVVWEARGDLGALSGVASVGRLGRGEPGPDGLDLGGAASAQRLSLASLTLTPPPSRPRAPTLALYASEHAYIYEEGAPLWQSAGRARFAFEDLSAGARLAWEPTRAPLLSPLSWGLTVSGGWTRAQTAEGGEGALRGGGERALASLTPTLALEAGPWRLEGATRLDLNTERSSLLVPSLTARWRGGEGAHIDCHTRASRAFRDPGLDERYLRGPGLLPNPTLRPEDGLWGELGCALRSPSRRWRFSATGFYQRYSRLILYVPLDVYRTQASDDFGARVWGAEVSGFARLTRAPLPPAHLEGRLSELSHEQRPLADGAPLGARAGRPLPLRPTRFGWARLSVEVDPVSLWLKAWGRGPLTLDRYALRTLPGALFWDAGLRRAWALERWRVSLDVSLQNLLGEQAQDALLRPLPGRSVWVSAEVSWVDF
jgi:hypothetical protein